MSDESVVQPERQVRWDGTTVAPGDVVQEGDLLLTLTR